MNFFSTNNSYSVTDKTDWNLDDGYPQHLTNNLFLIVNPIRTTGVSYYHRLRVVIHSLENEFINCEDNDPESENILVCNNKNYATAI